MTVKELRQLMLELSMFPEYDDMPVVTNDPNSRGILYDLGSKPSITDLHISICKDGYEQDWYESRKLAEESGYRLKDMALRL